MTIPRPSYLDDQAWAAWWWEAHPDPEMPRTVGIPDDEEIGYFDWPAWYRRRDRLAQTDYDAGIGRDG